MTDDTTDGAALERAQESLARAVNGLRQCALWGLLDHPIADAPMRRHYLDVIEFWADRIQALSTASVPNEPQAPQVCEKGD